MRRITVVLPLLVLLAGCGGAGESGASSTSAKSATSDGAGALAQPAVAKTRPIAVPRSLVRTAEISVRVDDVRRRATDAERIATQAGGQVADEQLDLQGASPRGSLKLQVPPGQLGPTLGKLAALGHERSRRLGTEDVTDQVVDLDSRLATQQQSVTRVRILLARATSLTDVVRIESELSRREADLESLQARVRAASGQVAMATVTVELTTRAKPAVSTSVGFGQGLRGGWHAFTATARVAAATVGAVLPFLPVLAVALLGALWWRRRTAAA